ncbi:MAG: nucleotidyltransferase domain-containing protein [Clostridia bacterium]|nr:nucleotidyltransferase domain-containing protein [Clostridia bacterium]
MFDWQSYLQTLISGCKAAFGERLLYVGLQGSYMRGEATENSDIDVMLILDRLSVDDMDVYRGILEQTGAHEKSCGFICGREEMARWNPLEVCQLLHTTKDLLGTLTDYLPGAAREDEINYVKLSLGNLYHALCHGYIHGDGSKSPEKLRGTCKALFFLIQNLYYLESGRFVATKKELKESVCANDREMLNLSDLPDGADFDAAFSAVFSWCQRVFLRMDALR